MENIAQNTNGAVQAEVQAALEGSSSSPTKRSAETQNAFSDLSVELDKRVLTTLSGIPILTNISQYATTASYEETDIDGLVIGFDLPGSPASLMDAAVGELSCSNFLALARAKLYWMLPVWGTSTAEIPVETQMLLLELINDSNKEKEYAILLPLIDTQNGFRCSLRPPSFAIPTQIISTDASLSMVVRMESGDEAVKTTAVSNAIYCTAGNDPYELIEKGVLAAARFSGTAQARNTKEQPDILDTFGWCSWDAMYTEVNPAGLQSGLKNLAAGGCPAQWCIIDDGWQQTELDGDFQKERKINGPRSSSLVLAASMREFSLAQMRSRRASADAVFQDLQITAPLRAIEKEEEENRQQRGSLSGSFYDIANSAHDAMHGNVKPLLSLPHRWLKFTWNALSSVRSSIEAAAMKRLSRALEGSHSDSNAIEIFSAMATGPFRTSLLRFYAAASSHSRRLLSVKANGKFSHIDFTSEDASLESQSDNFGQVIAELKQRCGLKYVLVWQALAGYWSGLMPGAEEVAAFDPEIMFPRPSPGTLEVDASMRWVHPAVVGVGIPRRPRAFHAALHSYLKESGVDGVKVDVQGTISMFGWKSGGYAAVARRFHESLEDSVALHLPGNLQLNSMCCDIETIYNLKNSSIARVGEDFYPTLKASHISHIANAAFTSLMIAPICHVDWDMMHSVHHEAELHAGARAVSGGLIYVSDRPGEHGFDLLKRLVLPDGSILRAKYPGRPTLDCLFKDISRDQKTVLKIFNLNAMTGMIGAFNVQGASWNIKRRNYVSHDANPPALVAKIKPADVHGLSLFPTPSSSGNFAIYSDALKQLKVMELEEEWEIELKGNGGFDLFVVSPVCEVLVPGKDGDGGQNIQVAPIGLINMMNAGGAILSEELVGKSEFAMEVRGWGQFLVYVSGKAPLKVVVGEKAVGFEYSEETCELRFEVPPPVQSDAGQIVIKF
jgi:raffinose synthase